MDSLLLSLPGIATLVVIAIAVISARNYDHRDAHYARDRQPANSIGHFRFVYRYLQITSIGVAIASFWFDHPVLLEWHHSNWLLICGLVAGVGCAWLFVASKRALGEHYSPCFDAYIPERTVSNGPYRYIRHPIYTANIALLAALGLATGSGWLLLNTLVLFAYYQASARAEEAELTYFHRDYRDYLGRTGRFLPRLRLGATGGDAGVRQ